jgi:hypothetical protein
MRLNSHWDVLTSPHCAAAFAALFSAVIAYNRLEFTISKDEKWQASQEADKITAVMQQINSVLEGRWGICM